MSTQLNDTLGKDPIAWGGIHPCMQGIANAQSACTQRSYGTLWCYAGHLVRRECRRIKRARIG